MRKRIAAFLVCLAVTATAAAQYGHPLSGTWSGDWGPNATTRNRVLLHLEWDGKAIVGSINPGQKDAVTLTKVTEGPVTPTYDAWNVRLEGKGVVVEGKVVNLGSYERTMSGTWTQNGQKGEFKLTRN